MRPPSRSAPPGVDEAATGAVPTERRTGRAGAASPHRGETPRVPARGRASATADVTLALHPRQSMTHTPSSLSRSLVWLAREWRRSTWDGFVVVVGGSVALGWLVAGRPGVVIGGALALLAAVVGASIRAARLVALQLRSGRAAARSCMGLGAVGRSTGGRRPGGTQVQTESVAVGACRHCPRVCRARRGRGALALVGSRGGVRGPRGVGARAVPTTQAGVARVTRVSRRRTADVQRRVR